ncbi:hypothetical protein BR93DRAFT_991763 [Coniochaeta sp. PMI_546]|nr:hypothetical protein BR93DRAFT_991763 [Coniochaeta sp. PMI_546]
MWRTKDHLRSEIERLRKELQQCQGLIKAFIIGGTAEEWRTIQSRMHRGDPPDRIVAWIASTRSSAVAYPNELSPEQTDQRTVSPERSRQSISSEPISVPETSIRYCPEASPDATLPLQPFVEEPYIDTTPGLVSPAVSGHSNRSGRRLSSYPHSDFTHDGPSTPQSLHPWTGVIQDVELLHRLVHHYFDHCFPDFSFVCKERFLGDLDKETGVYCSATLLNAILGLASQSYDASSKGGLESCPSRHFLSQANELLRAHKARPGMTDIQATGILALAEANVGNDEAAYYLATDCARRAVLLKLEMDSEFAQTDDPFQLEALATTFCGAFSLIRIFRILTGRLSCQSGPLFMRLTSNNDVTATDTPAARVERGVALQQHFFSQLDRCPQLLRFINTVTEIAHTICSYHHDDGVTPADLVPAYDKCLQAWSSFSSWLPTRSETDRNVLFAQIWYNYILTVLFSTLIDSSIDLRNGITPEAVVIQASETIIFLTGVYQAQYGFLSVHPFLPHMVFAATLVQLRRPLSTDYKEQRTPGTGYKRRGHSEPQSPIGGTIHALGNVAAEGNSLRRGSPDTSDTPELIYPSWKHHIAPMTMRQAAITNNLTDADDNNSSVSDLVWPSKPPSEVAAEGTLHLTKIGITNRKAAELAQAIRVRTSARPAAPTLTMTGQASQWTPGWEPVIWGPSTDNGAGFGGLGIGNQQGFSAMTSNTPGGLGSIMPQAAPEDIVADGVTSIAGSQGFPKYSEDLSENSYGGLYIYPSPLPQVGGEGSFGEYTPLAMNNVDIASFAGCMSKQEDAMDDLA